jgi:hypothetical protein
MQTIRRIFAAGFAAAVVAGVAACGDGGDGDSVENTAQVCDQAAQVQMEQTEQLNAELMALQEDPEVGEEDFQVEAVALTQQALQGWSDGLREQAGVADNPELAGTLTDLADGLDTSASELTFENLETGQIPGAEELDEIGWTLTEICEGAAPEQTPAQ